jgi:plasmid stabilization system protein ParE
MGSTVVIISQAWRDLGDIITYIARDNPAAAERFAEALLQAALFLGQAPGLGCRVKGFPDIRMTVYRRYLIFYRLDSSRERLFILRFWHSARDRKELRLGT